MPIKINQQQDKMPFTEKYYWDKFQMKNLERDPNDLEAKEKIEFINNFLREGNESKWASVWQEWEKNNFCWPIEQIIPDNYKK